MGHGLSASAKQSCLILAGSNQCIPGAIVQPSRTADHHSTRATFGGHNLSGQFKATIRSRITRTSTELRRVLSANELSSSKPIFTP